MTKQLLSNEGLNEAHSVGVWTDYGQAEQAS